LDKLAEHVLIPAMGWCYYYHDNYFMDTRDGSVFGDWKIQRGPDHVWKFLHGFYWMDNSKVRLCDLMQTPKTSLVWVYDLGARMEHTVELTRIEERVAGRKRYVGGRREHELPPELGAGFCEGDEGGTTRDDSHP
jgi:hypothetical protein